MKLVLTPQLEVINIEFNIPFKKDCIYLVPSRSHKVFEIEYQLCESPLQIMKQYLWLVSIWYLPCFHIPLFGWIYAYRHSIHKATLLTRFSGNKDRGDEAIDMDGSFPLLGCQSAHQQLPLLSLGIQVAQYCMTIIVLCHFS
jgi:hypothetical protein